MPLKRPAAGGESWSRIHYSSLILSPVGDIIPMAGILRGTGWNNRMKQQRMGTYGMKRIKAFAKKETVLSAAIVLALVSMVLGETGQRVSGVHGLQDHGAAVLPYDGHGRL